MSAPTGVFSELACNVCGAVVHSFEPNPVLAEALRVWAADAARVTVAEVALGDRGGTTRLRIPVGHTGAASVVAFTSGRSDTVCVNQLTLDDYAAVNGPPTVIKLDVEGFENEVLRGSARTLEAHEPVVIMEVHHRTSGPHLVREIRAVERLRDLGYRQLVISNDGIAEDRGGGRADLDFATERFGYANILFDRGGRDKPR